jgi:uncharacterized membrane protein YvlD (DUF360 family)
VAVPARRRYLVAAVRLLAMLAITAVALMIPDLVSTGFSVDKPWLAIPMAATIWLLSVAVRPLLIDVALPLVALTGGPGEKLIGAETVHRVLKTWAPDS